MLSVQYLHGSSAHKREKSINSCLPVVALSPSLLPLSLSLFPLLAASDEIITVLTGIRGLPLCIVGKRIPTTPSPRLLAACTVSFISHTETIVYRSNVRWIVNHACTHFSLHVTKDIFVSFFYFLPSSSFRYHVWQKPDFLTFSFFKSMRIRSHRRFRVPIRIFSSSTRVYEFDSDNRFHRWKMEA